MSKEEFLKTQTCVLKVNIHCEGCKAKVKKVLHKIEGVYTTAIDTELGKVTVLGNVQPATLIKKLNKNGKFAEIWGGTKNQQPSNAQNQQIGNGKSGNSNKNQTQKGAANAQGQNLQIQQLEKMKALQDLKTQMKVAVNDKDQKAVKMNLPAEEGSSDDGEFETDEEFDDYDGEEGDEFEDEIDAPPVNKMKAVIGNSQQMPNMMMKNMLNGQQQAIKNGSNGGSNAASAKKPGGGGNNAGVGGGGGGNGNGNINDGGKKSGGGKGGKNSGPQLQDAKNSGGNGGNPNKNAVNHGGAGGGPPNATNFTGNGSRKEMMMMNDEMGPTGHMPMAHPHMTQMGNLHPNPTPQAVGYYPPGSTYQMSEMPLNEQQQYAAMMMNMQRANGNERFQPMVYARPPPAVSYMPPSYPYYTQPSSSSGDRSDGYGAFSDEDTESCSVM